MYDTEINRLWDNVSNHFRKRIEGFSDGKIRENFEYVIFDAYKSTPGTPREKHKAAIDNAILYIETLLD